MKGRRELGLIIAVGLALLAAPLPVADAQAPVKVPRIGVLVPAGPVSPVNPMLAAFRQSVRGLGYVEGQTVIIEASQGVRRPPVGPLSREAVA